MSNGNTLPLSDPFFGCPLVDNHKEFECNDFQREVNLCDFIEEQATVFAKEVLGIDYQGHSREYYISGDRRINRARKGRVDFKFVGPNGDIYVECKNPTQTYSASVNAITQLLAYSCLADTYGRNISRLVLITTHYNPILIEVIKKFNLPIEVYILSKSNVMKLIVGGCHG